MSEAPRVSGGWRTSIDVVQSRRLSLRYRGVCCIVERLDHEPENGDSRTGTFWRITFTARSKATLIRYGLADDQLFEPCDGRRRTPACCSDGLGNYRRYSAGLLPAGSFTVTVEVDDLYDPDRLYEKDLPRSAQREAGRILKRVGRAGQKGAIMSTDTTLQRPPGPPRRKAKVAEMYGVGAKEIAAICGVDERTAQTLERRDPTSTGIRADDSTARPGVLQ